METYSKPNDKGTYIETVDERYGKAIAIQTEVSSKTTDNNSAVLTVSTRRTSGEIKLRVAPREIKSSKPLSSTK